jgi:hypothetical protein
MTLPPDVLMTPEVQKIVKNGLRRQSSRDSAVVNTSATLQTMAAHVAYTRDAGNPYAGTHDYRNVWNIVNTTRTDAQIYYQVSTQSYESTCWLKAGATHQIDLPVQAQVRILRVEPKSGNSSSVSAR